MNRWILLFLYYLLFSIDQGVIANRLRRSDTNELLEDEGEYGPAAIDPGEPFQAPNEIAAEYEDPNLYDDYDYEAGIQGGEADNSAEYQDTGIVAEEGREEPIYTAESDGGTMNEGGEIYDYDDEEDYNMEEREELEHIVGDHNELNTEADVWDEEAEIDAIAASRGEAATVEGAAQHPDLVGGIAPVEDSAAQNDLWPSSLESHLASPDNETISDIDLGGNFVPLGDRTEIEVPSIMPSLVGHLTPGQPTEGEDMEYYEDLSGEEQGEDEGLMPDEDVLPSQPSSTQANLQEPDLEGQPTQRPTHYKTVDQAWLRELHHRFTTPPQHLANTSTAEIEAVENGAPSVEETELVIQNDEETTGSGEVREEPAILTGEHTTQSDEYTEQVNESQNATPSPEAIKVTSASQETSTETNTPQLEDAFEIAENNTAPAIQKNATRALNTTEEGVTSPSSNEHAAELGETKASNATEEGVTSPSSNEHAAELGETKASNATEEGVTSPGSAEHHGSALGGSTLASTPSIGNPTSASPEDSLMLEHPEEYSDLQLDPRCYIPEVVTDQTVYLTHRGHRQHLITRGSMVTHVQFEFLDIHETRNNVDLALEFAFNGPYLITMAISDAVMSEGEDSVSSAHVFSMEVKRPEQPWSILEDDYGHKMLFHLRRLDETVATRLAILKEPQEVTAVRIYPQDSGLHSTLRLVWLGCSLLEQF